MGKIELDSKITGQMKTWGGEYESMDGCAHNPVADKEDPQIENKNITLNVMSKMDASHAKPNSMNPGVDMGFWGKAKPLSDTTGHGMLTRKLQD